MAQVFRPSCPRCGAINAPGQRFCSNCGATLDAGFSNPTASAAGEEHYQQVPELPTELSVPPPPPTGSYGPTAQQPSHTYYPPQSAPGFSQAQQSYVPPAQPLPAYTKPQKDSSKGVLGQIGCGVGLIILLALVVCAGTGYFGYRWLTSLANNGSTSTVSNTTNSASNGSNNGATPLVPLTTKNINATVTYASVDITILNAQEASSFSNDANTNSPVLLRLNITEHNPTTGTIFLAYNDNFHLVLPDGTTVAPSNTHDIGAVSQAVTQTSWLDYSLPSSIDVAAITLRLGGANQVQENVPLTGNANLSKYQAKTISPNTVFQYAGLKWTLTNVISSFSADGKQADSDMRYITVTLKVDNPTSNVFFPSISTYARLQSGSIVNSPTGDTFPITIAAGTTGATGTVTFQMPQSNSSVTLMILARTDINPPAAQVTTNFQI